MPSGWVTPCSLSLRGPDWVAVIARHLRRRRPSSQSLRGAPGAEAIHRFPTHQIVDRLPRPHDCPPTVYVEAQALMDRNDVPANVLQAIERLQQAVDADNSFAIGYAALGATLLLRYERTRD